VVLKILQKFPRAALPLKFNSSPLHVACSNSQSDNVVLQLISVFPQAAREKDDNGWYPLQLACRYGRSDSIVLKLLEVFPQATNGPGICCCPLHLAYIHNQSERVLWALIDSNPRAAKHMLTVYNVFTLCRRVTLSANVVQTIQEITAKSDYDLQHRIGIPKIVAINGLNNVRRLNTIQWVLGNSPAR
jgi:Ankyrin repeats (3 copies)